MRTDGICRSGIPLLKPASLPFRVYAGSEIWCSDRLRQPDGAPCTSRLSDPLRRRLRPAAIPHQQVTDASDVGLL